MLCKAGLVESDHDSRVVSTIQGVDVRYDCADEFSFPALSFKHFLLFYHFRVDKGGGDDFHAPFIITFGIESSRLLDVVDEANNFNVFIICFYQLVKMVSFRDSRCSFQVLASILGYLLFEFGETTCELGVGGGHGGPEMMVERRGDGGGGDDGGIERTMVWRR